MKKGYIILLLTAALIISAWIIGRVTGMLQFYNIPTTANEPAVKKHELLFTSNLVNAAKYKFITFTSNYMDSVNMQYTPGLKRGSHYLFRLCGMPGDVLEMKNGVLYVNQKNFDEFLDLKNQYIITKKDFALIAEEDIPKDEEAYEFMVGGDSAIITLDNAQYKKYIPLMKLARYTINDTSATGGGFKWLDEHTTWTLDNFGPLTLPPGCCFVLGDNRHFAMDSRYTGFVKKENIKGVVLGR